MNVVIDTNVFISAAGSRATSSWRCFYLLAKRRFRLAVTEQVLNEYQRIARDLAAKSGRFHGMDWRSLYDWVQDTAEYFEPAPLGKQRSRDPDDDVFIACALAAGAKILVSHDADLLDLEKPFGIEMLRPAAFVRRINSQARHPDL